MIFFIRNSSIDVFPISMYGYVSGTWVAYRECVMVRKQKIRR